MAQKFLVPIDFSKLEAYNFRLQNLATAPANPVEGQIYYDTDDDLVYLYTGGGWTSLAISSAIQTSEQIEDLVGAMFSGNNETRITATYDDASGKIDLTVDALSAEEVQDAVAGLLAQGGNISLTYDDNAGTLTIAVTGVGSANGIASLDSGGKVPDSQIPAGIARDSEVTAAIAAIDFPVDSVNGQTGAVVLDAADVGARPDTWTPADGDIPASIARDSEVTAAIAAIDFPVDSVNGQTGAVTLGAADVGAIATTARGAANGVASLDAGGTVPDAQIPAGIARDSEVSSAIAAIDYPVDSVNGQTGAVTLDATDVGADPAGTAAAAVAAIDYPVDSVNGQTGTVTLDAGDVGAVPAAAVGAADGVASLDSGGKVPAAQLPAVSLTDVTVVADIAARDALTVQEGDVAIVTSTSQTFIYDGADWIEVTSPVDGVTAVTATGPLSSTGGTTPEISIDAEGITGGYIADGTITADKLAETYTRKVSATLGDAAATSYAVTHGLGTRDVTVEVYDSTTYETVYCDVVRNTTNQVTLTFAVAPATNAYRVVVVG